jgi:hypothetical protein
MIIANESDVEYNGYYIKKVRYYEPWDEWIHKTCSYTTCSGSGKTRSCVTHYYDCSYRKYHSEYWVMVDNVGREHEISQKYYNWLKNRFNSTSIFVDMDRNYYTIDGDAYDNSWLGEINRSWSITSDENYLNKVKASHSVFKYENIDEIEKNKWKLHEYPDIQNDRTQPSIIGYKGSINDSIVNKYQYLNGFYGKTCQIRAFVVVYYNQPLSVVNKQLSYFEGENKNEFLIFVGLDSLTNKVQFCKTISWMDKPTLGVYTESFINDNIDTLNNTSFNKLGDWLIINVPKHWKRKEFSDFDYLQVEVTETQYFIILGILLLYNIIVGITLYFKNGDLKKLWR